MRGKLRGGEVWVSKADYDERCRVVEELVDKYAALMKKYMALRRRMKSRVKQ